jgi:signal transduction histidine kinase
MLPVLHALARAMHRLHADRGLAIDIDGPPDLAVRVPLEDLEELAGNLLDNACKWARTRVAVAVLAPAPDAPAALLIDDDGPGLEPSMREKVLQRGVRADESAPGTGLGLSIVCDLAEAYGGRLQLDASPLGGLRATLFLPPV